MADEATVRSLGERYALCLAEERDLARSPGAALGPFPDDAAECQEWLETQGVDPDEELSSEEDIRALVPRVLEVAQKTWAFLDERFPQDPRGPTVFL